VASAVPASFGTLEDAYELFEFVKQSGLINMMFETSCFREDLSAMHQVYKAGGCGRLMFAEGEYWHFVDIATALNMTVGGIVADQSAIREGEWLSIPQFKL
jgi:hypothetical protein